MSTDPEPDPPAAATRLPLHSRPIEPTAPAPAPTAVDGVSIQSSVMSTDDRQSAGLQGSEGGSVVEGSARERASPLLAGIVEDHAVASPVVDASRGAGVDSGYITVIDAKLAVQALQAYEQRRGSVSTRKTAVGLAMEGVLPDPRWPLGPPPPAPQPPPLPPGVKDGLFVHEDPQDPLPRASPQPDTPPRSDEGAGPQADPTTALPTSLLAAAAAAALASPSSSSTGPASPTPLSSGGRAAADDDIEAQLSEAERAAPGTELAAMARVSVLGANDPEPAPAAPSAAPRRPWWRWR